ncbi:MAG: hypothetical protein ACK6CE_08995 [Planctomycetota bacterium]
MNTTDLSSMSPDRLARQRLLSLDSQALAEHQLLRLNQLLGEIMSCNRFYQQKLVDLRPSLGSLEELSQLPFTFKDELVANDQHWSPVANLSFPLERYVRYHQTSGTRGRPLVVLDTPEDWQWWVDTWQYILDTAEVRPGDRCVMAFSFGPFIGFWSAFDAVRARGALAVPTGGLNTLARLEMILSVQATVLTLFRDLQREFNLTYILVSHDLAVVGHMCDRLMVMQLGQGVEEMQAATLSARAPVTEYAKELLTASEGFRRS